MTAYLCDDVGRRAELTRAGGRLNGIDGVEVDTGHAPDVPAWRTLLVECLRPVPASLGAADLEISAPAVAPVAVEWAYPAGSLAAARARDPRVSQQDVDVFGQLPDAGSTLVVRTATAGLATTYQLSVQHPEVHDFDPRLCTAAFAFRLDCSDEIDSRPPSRECVERAPAPVIDYLNRDYVSLRRMLLDRLSLVLPPWSDRNVADLSVMLVELFAYAGDHLAAAQDAAAAEAYLGTARQRISIARHARLLDYHMHQGAAARTWLVATASSAVDRLILEGGTEVCSADGATTFRTLHAQRLRTARNEVPLYTWGDQRCCLPRGATSATLVGTARDLRLQAGDAVALEEVRGGVDGLPEHADPGHRWVVRLDADPRDDHDPVTGTDVVAISWFEEDALPFPICAWSYPQGRCYPPVNAAVARGNVVLLEHGRLVEAQPLVPPVVPRVGRYRPHLPDEGLAFCVPYDHTAARARPAAAVLEVAPERATPAIELLTDGQRRWSVTPEILTSTAFAPEAVIEVDDGRRARLRFGNGVVGRRPTAGNRFVASYRIGGGIAGNVGRDTLTRLVQPIEGVAVRNPVVATGGAEPEDIEQVRQWAPQAFRMQQRAVTDADYQELAGRDPRVQHAVATRQWTGSWYTELVSLDRVGGGPVDGRFRDELQASLDAARMAGGDVALAGPTFVPLDIVLTVHVENGRRPDQVRDALRSAFAPTQTEAGTGFFHPDNFTFAQPVFLSAVVAAAMAVPGVAWVSTAESSGSPNRFRRWGLSSEGEWQTGRITIGRLEIARCDSDPDHPENGRIDFMVESGP